MVSDFGAAANKVANLKDELEDQHERATKRSMKRLQTNVRFELLTGKSRSYARGTLWSEVSEDPKPEPTLTTRSVNVPNWAKYLEKGTGPKGTGEFKAPSYPPYKQIRIWAHAKPINPRKYSTIDAAAGAIAQSISEEGTIPHPFLRPAWHGTNGKDTIVDANIRAMRRALRRTF